MSSLTQLQVWQGFIDGSTRPNDMISDLVPMKFLTVEKGYIKVSAVADKRHLLPSGIAHGGFCATVIDTVTAGAVSTGLDHGYYASTTDLNVKMVKGVPAGVTLIAEARIVTQGRKLGTAEARVVDEEGAIYAWGTATCMVRERRK